NKMPQKSKHRKYLVISDLGYPHMKKFNTLKEARDQANQYMNSTSAIYQLIDVYRMQEGRRRK
ncbi:unnamed protein product, partial [marine sediment metagenome]